MQGILAVREQKSIEKINNEIGVYLLEVEKIKDWGLIVDEAINQSDYCETTKRRKLTNNQTKQRELIKALL